MNTWLLTWNEKRWPWHDPIDGYLETLCEVSKYGISITKWSCGVTKSIQPNDRIFMIHLGCEPRGIFASGIALSQVIEGTHWDQEKAARGIKAKRIYVQFDKMLNIGQTILSMDKLKDISDTMKWSSQSSGISIPDDTVIALEKEWKTYKTSKVNKLLLPLE